MRELIQSEFLAPLANVYGPHNPNLADELEKRIKPMSGEAMRAAAERMIRTRKAKGFPSFPECLKALAAADVKQPGSFETKVTAKNYGDLAIAYSRSHDGPIVITPADAVAWREWRAYFHRIGYKGSTIGMAEAKSWTVPAHFPHLFDPSFPTITAAAEFGRPPPTPEEVARIKAGFAKLQKELIAAWDAGLDKRSPTYKRPHEREADEKAEAKRRLDQPIGLDGVKLSPEAQSKFTPKDQLPEEKGSAA